MPFTASNAMVECDPCRPWCLLSLSASHLIELDCENSDVSPYAQARGDPTQAYPRPRSSSGGPQLPLALADLGLIDEYHDARIAGYGPTWFAGLRTCLDLKLIERSEFKSGTVAMRYELSK